MCEHCSSGFMWEGDTKADVCAWRNAEQPEDEVELPVMCPNPATRVVREKFVEDHLCNEHVDQENADLDCGVGDLYRSFGLQQSVAYLPIRDSQCPCSGYLGNPLQGGPMTKCLNPATHAKMVIENYTYCEKHIMEIA